MKSSCRPSSLDTLSLKSSCRPASLDTLSLKNYTALN
jgi:hypothetical protein